MSRLSNILKPIMPILAAVYGFMLIYMTALPMADGNETLDRQVLSWGFTLLAVYCTLGLGEIRMSRMPVIILSDTIIVVAAVILAVIGFTILQIKLNENK